MGHVDEAGEVRLPFIWNEDRRLHLRAKLDALYFILYGVFDPADPAQGRDDIRYIYSTFPLSSARKQPAMAATAAATSASLDQRPDRGQPDSEVEG